MIHRQCHKKPFECCEWVYRENSTCKDKELPQVSMIVTNRVVLMVLWCKKKILAFIWFLFNFFSFIDNKKTKITKTLNALKSCRQGATTGFYNSNKQGYVKGLMVSCFIHFKIVWNLFLFMHHPVLFILTQIIKNQLPVSVDRWQHWSMVWFAPLILWKIIQS